MLIGEVAKLAGLSKDGIRHYESLGLIQSTPRQAGSKVYREYDSSVLHTIEQIRGAQHFLRLSLHEIGPLFRTIEEDPPTNAQRLEYLEERLTVVRKQVQSLHEVEEHLREKVERLRKELVRSRKRTKPVSEVPVTAECRDPGKKRPRKPLPKKISGLAVYRHEQVRI